MIDLQTLQSTFEAAGAAYEEMEALYETVMDCSGCSYATETDDARKLEAKKKTVNVATSRLPHGVEDDGRPPLLMFNGIGANLELAFPFFNALVHTRGIIFDIPGVGGSPRICSGAM